LNILEINSLWHLVGNEWINEWFIDNKNLRLLKDYLKDLNILLKCNDEN
jgi:hypothetical protein